MQAVVSKHHCPMVFLSHGKTCSGRRAKVETSPLRGYRTQGKDASCMGILIKMVKLRSRLFIPKGHRILRLLTLLRSHPVQGEFLGI